MSSLSLQLDCGTLKMLQLHEKLPEIMNMLLLARVLSLRWAHSRCMLGFVMCRCRLGGFVSGDRQLKIVRSSHDSDLMLSCCHWIRLWCQWYFDCSHLALKQKHSRIDRDAVLMCYCVGCFVKSCQQRRCSRPVRFGCGDNVHSFFPLRLHV